MFIITCLLSMNTISCHNRDFELFISNAKIQARVKELAQKINTEYQGKNPIFIGILNGVYRFAGDLFNYIDIECEISFVKIKSYVGTQSGTIKTALGLDESINFEGRDIIILEDIVDTGKTLYNFLPKLQQKQPASIKIITLLTKPEAIQYDIPLAFVGFAVPNLFLVGYGLDYYGLARHYNDIYQIIE